MLIDSLNELALSGGNWVIYLLLFTSVMSVYVMCERYFFFRKITGQSLAIRKFVTEHLVKGDVEAVHAELKRFQCPESRILLAGLSAAARGPVGARERSESQLILEKAALERNLVLLATVGSNAPFVGLFGTVLGVIKAFHELSLQGASSGGTLVMRGISEALIATAVGILVAIPALVAYNYFKDKVKNALAQAESLNHLAMSYMKPPAP
ncbi:MAG: MotA/TolQ/ExbB proton channel family protein [Elusimicrobiota bacterium]